MLLREYCESIPGGYERVAERSGYYRSDIWKIANAKAGFSVRKGQRIVAACEGKVTFEDLGRPFVMGAESAA